jgi:hypothetical protein
VYFIRDSSDRAHHGKQHFPTRRRPTAIFHPKIGDPTLIGAALMMDEEQPEVRTTLAAIGVWEITVALLTRARPYARRGGRNLDERASAGMVESGSWSQQSMPSAPTGSPLAAG